MNAPHVRTRRRLLRRERGASMVEAAIVLPIVATITFATIEFGLIFLSQSTTLSSAQAGVRLAAAQVPTAGSPITAYDQARDEVLDNIDALSAQGTPGNLWIYRADTDGGPFGATDFDSCATECRIYRWDGTTFAYQSGSWATPDACIFDGDGVDSIGVYVDVQHAPITGFVFDTITLREHSTAQLEPLPSEEC